MSHRLVLQALTLALVLAACTSSGDDPNAGTLPEQPAEVASDDGDNTSDAPSTDPDDRGAIVSDAEAQGIDVDEILAELLDAGFCDTSDVEGAGDIGEVTAMHFVVDGVPREPCAGARDDRLDTAWEQLSAIAPHEYVADVSLLAGYEACAGCDTLAFVEALDEQGTFFLMAIDVTAAQDDPDELLLTLLHELAHVITQDPLTQLDVAADPDDCETYYNGNGCLLPTSYTWAWIQTFWEPSDLAAIDEGEPDELGGEQRCDLYPSYTGSYGASSPEEDLAEVFSAYVFDVALGPSLDPKRDFFEQRPEFRRIRVRAAELGLTDLDHSFEGCG